MPAKHIETSIDIAASTAQVWQVLMDWPRYPEWNPFIIGLHGRHEVGARLVVTLHLQLKQRMTFRPRVQQLQAEQTLSWLGHWLHPSLFAGEHVFQLQALDDTHCRLQHSEVFTGWLLPLFGQRMLDNTRKGFERMNQALKQRVESLNTPLATEFQSHENHHENR
ncbi:SRPBCC domain-containing protein [Neisseriaceae bacterium TC5R-5]|nr:SRPBCC domain-containing protein [Neisseriaceae bacterium TC5R-5]